MPCAGCCCPGRCTSLDSNIPIDTEQRSVGIGLAAFIQPHFNCKEKAGNIYYLYHEVAFLLSIIWNIIPIYFLNI